MVALHLVEAGLLDLDADANDFLHFWQIPKSKHTQLGTDGVQQKVTLRCSGKRIHLCCNMLEFMDIANNLCPTRWAVSPSDL